MYTPNDINVFIAAFSGAMTGMGVSGRIPTNNNSLNYTGLANIAGAWAESFDTEWGTTLPNQFDLACITQMSQDEWKCRTPLNISPFSTPSTYTQRVQALIAIIQAGNSFITTQNIQLPDSNFFSGTISTSGAETKMVCESNIVTDNSAFNANANIYGRTAIGETVVQQSIQISGKRNTGVISLGVLTSNGSYFSDAAVAAYSYNLIDSSNKLALQVTGVALKDIDWFGDLTISTHL